MYILHFRFLEFSKFETMASLSEQDDTQFLARPIRRPIPKTRTDPELGEQSSFSPSKVRSKTAQPLDPEDSKRSREDLKFKARLSKLQQQAFCEQSLAEKVARASTEKANTISELSGKFDELSKKLETQKADYNNAIREQHKYERASTLCGARIRNLSQTPPTDSDDIIELITEIRAQWKLALDKIRETTEYANIAKQNLDETRKHLKVLEVIISKNTNTSTFVAENLKSATASVQQSFVDAVNMCVTWFATKAAPMCQEFEHRESEAEDDWCCVTAVDGSRTEL